MSTATKTAKRVKFVLDEEYEFEECNGESRPLTEEEYRENCYRGCLVHPRSTVPAVNVRAGLADCGECGQPYQDLPYSEYLAYYGNPDRHVYVACIAEEQCPHCGSWKQISSVWGIDFMDDSPEYLGINLDEYYTEEQAKQLPGYAGDVAREEMGG